MSLVSDCRYTLRIIAKKPGFTALTALVTAAGIGLSVFLFSMFHTILFKDLPFENGEDIVQINRYEQGRFAWGGLSLHDYQVIRDELHHLADFTLFTTPRINVQGPDSARRYNAAYIEHDFFTYSSTAPLLGRVITEEETHKGQNNVTLINYDVWQNQFAGRRDILGQDLYINNTPHTIIGVMPEGYVFPDNTSIWLPHVDKTSQLSRDNTIRVYGMARLKSTITATMLNKEMDFIMQRLAEEYPETNTEVSAKATTFSMVDMEEGIAVVQVLHISAVLILLLASINVGNLILSRAIERNKETAIRAALGAPRFRLIRQILLESAFICALGGAIGLCLLAWGLEITQATVANFFTDPPPFWWQFGLDAFTVSLFFGALFFTFVTTGLLPALKSTNADFNAVLRDGTRGAQSKKSSKLNRLLVTSEVFISLAILISAATAVHGAFKASHADFGAETDNIVVAKIEMGKDKHSTPQKRIEFISSLQTLLEEQPNIEMATYMSDLPGEWSYQKGVEIEGHEYLTAGPKTYPSINAIATDKMAMQNLGIHLLNGRYFNSADDQYGKRTVIVTQSFSDEYFPNNSAIGKRFKLHADSQPPTDWLTIVGVVENTIQGNANDIRSKTPSVFRPYNQEPRYFLTLAVRTKHPSTDFVAVETSIRSALKFIDPTLPAYMVEPYQSALDRTGAPVRFISSIFALFGIVAVLLSASGIYGVMGNTIRQKTHEIGVKRALGAFDGHITKELMWNGGKQLLYGGVPGTLVGGAMGWGMSQILGVDATSVVVLTIIMVGIVSGAVFTAIYVPTRRALRLEPADALRYE